MTPLEALSAINPPSRLRNLGDVIEVFDDPSMLTLCEASFFANLDHFMLTIREEGIPGDLVEAGVWRGGVGIYLKALLAHLGIPGRTLWLADTFAGFPGMTDTKHSKDCRAFPTVAGFNARAPKVEEVLAVFHRLGLLDESVRVLEGDVAHTLPSAGIAAVALLHIDVDFYDPTWACLTALYDRLSPGGYVIVDDYGVPFFNCRDAVDEFRETRGIEEPITMLNDYAACWRRRG